jgi:4-fold beta flower protein
MKLLPLMDHGGVIRAWADRKSGWICDPIGNVLLLIAFDSVFRFSGEQVGWFYGDHIRDRYGRVVLARPGAKIEGLPMARPQKIPPSPKPYLPTSRPALQWLLPPPVLPKQRAWRTFESLFNDGLERVRAFEKKLSKFGQTPAISSHFANAATQKICGKSPEKLHFGWKNVSNT